jgi:hypothetical protein
VELTPHGTQFTVSVTVTLPYISTSTSLSVISIEDENDATWEEITGSSFDDGTATVELDHFSFLTVAAGTPAACGNGLIDGSEQCDGINLRGESCETQGFVGGTLGCAADCTAFDISGCTVGPVCGDKVAEPPEVCDGTDLAGDDCLSQGFTGGTLGCAADCTAFDISGCAVGPVCGDNVAVPPEVCDGRDLAGEDCLSQGFTGGTLACNASCDNVDLTGCTGVPPGWTCPVSFYGGADGCHCGCGVLDPDCVDNTAAACQYCGDEGSCNPIGSTCPGDLDPDKNWLCESRVELNEGDGQTGLAGFAVNIPPSVRVLDGNDNPVVGEPVTFAVTGGGGSVAGANQTTDDEGVAAVGKWTLGATPGTNTLEATTAIGSVTFTATGVTSSYDIDVRLLSSGSPTVEEAFLDAADRWESLVIGDLPNIPVNVGPGNCGPGSPAINETIDDLLIFATIGPIDGPGGILGMAGPCGIRTSNLPFAGAMIFDEDDLADLQAAGYLGDVILHEMGHVIGYGTVWESLGLLADPAQSGGTDPHFTGPLAIAAFDRIGGAGHSGAKVPVEATGGQGTADSHWRETVLDNELMTGFLNAGSNPLSELSVASLWDMGYPVNLDGSDNFSITELPLARAAASLSLGDDILRLPLWFIDEGGRVVEVIENR